MNKLLGAILAMVGVGPAGSVFNPVYRQSATDRDEQIQAAILKRNLKNIQRAALPTTVWHDGKYS